MFKRFALAALLCVPAVFASSYHFTIGDKVQAGTVQLKPGEYSVSVKGSQAVFTDQYGKQTTAAVKVDTADSKFSATEVVCSTTGGSEHIEYIGLKGSNQKLVFNQ
jgi:hypothetical protein